MKYSFKENTPLWLSIIMIAVAALATIPISNLLVLLYKYFQISRTPNLTLTELGQLGDFFGGHTSAFSGSVSLVVVLFFTFHQARQQAEFFKAQRQAEDDHAQKAIALQEDLFNKQNLSDNTRAEKALEQEKSFFEEQRRIEERNSTRQFFLEGINLISQWDIKEPGCEQGMRLLDYYSRVALKLEDDELLLILNTVITDKIRGNLEGKNGAHHQRNYAFAIKANNKIGQIREAEMRPKK